MHSLHISLIAADSFSWRACEGGHINVGRGSKRGCQQRVTSDDTELQRTSSGINTRCKEQRK